jgi:hypothetical protein
MAGRDGPPIAATAAGETDGANPEGRP